jgi:hypothetical protein
MSGCHALGWKRDVKQGLVTWMHKVVQKRDVKRGAWATRAGVPRSA